jgi:HAD superfamily phosphoserine phosphatase-like hydrolase
VCDFDGTLAVRDVGNDLVDRFGDGGWRAIDARWIAGELGIADAQRLMWASVRATDAELRAHAREVGALRPGAAALFDAAAAGRIELVIASGGFGLYVHEILGARAALARDVIANELRIGAGGGVEVVFRDGLACARCAICKANVVRVERARGREVIFAGDGSSDRCVVDTDARIFAVAGSLLAKTCETRGRAHTAFDDLRAVLDAT